MLANRLIYGKMAALMAEIKIWERALNSLEDGPLKIHVGLLVEAIKKNGPQIMELARTKGMVG